MKAAETFQIKRQESCESEVKAESAKESAEGGEVVYGEKKSWEYHYNYEGMDQKMVEQRKRRIALK